MYAGCGKLFDRGLRGLRGWKPGRVFYICVIREAEALRDAHGAMGAIRGLSPLVAALPRRVIHGSFFRPRGNREACQGNFSAVLT